MKKTGAFCLTLCIFLSFFRIDALAYSDPVTESIAEEAGADGLENEYLDRDELSGDKSINIFEKVFLIISDALSSNSKGLIGSFGAILGVIILCCVMNALKISESESLNNACGYISVLVLSGVTYSVLYNLFIFVIASMESLTLAMSSLLPIMASLYVFSGSSAAGAAAASGMTVFLNVLSVICTQVILPLLQAAFALCLVSAIPASISLSSVTNLVKNTATTLLAFIFTLLGFVLYFQTSVASASDGFLARSVRFASGVFVPVIGGMLGDASRTVMASVSVIKGTVGAAGVVAVLSVVLPPLIAVILNKLMLLGCSIAARALGCEKESALLYDLGNVLGVLLALVLGAGTVCIIAMAVFVKTGVNV